MMKRYWDSSALIHALQDAALEQKALEPGQFTRAHALAEVFSTLTGGRLGFKLLPNDAAAMIAELTEGFHFVDLSGDETMLALAQAQSRGVRGGRVHDYLHAIACKKCGASELITDNDVDFSGLEDGFKITVP